ncbi:MAG: cyclic nucleotide-binding protein [Deltaproteobacteria bacterium]|nr:MAG: cyclic nucleotide-binding protein [Deltaproteobacteria bacterium]
MLNYLFLFCGASVAVIRVIIPLGYDLVYPLLFMLKSQYEVLLALLFWNLANDLFNTRQSKRLFPLISAGGISGQILGSFSTPFIVRAITIDNLLTVYLAITLLGALVVTLMRRRFPSLLFSTTARAKASPRNKNAMTGEIKKIIPLIKTSPLIMLMILLTFIPNVVIPIMNYQFNFAINDQFATETKLIEFFGYFRGVLNTISLVILLFVGRIYGRWGLPVALMFHPLNYMFVFIAFFLRFDAFTAIYARMSSNIIRSTINIPTMAVLTGLFPETYRNIVRPFLRGTVVRIALFLGSGLILLSTGLFHPRYLSLIALPFVMVWVITPFILKKRYSRILLDLISQKTFDFKSFESKEIIQLFKDRALRDHLKNVFASSHGEDCLWYARLMQSLGLPDLDALILEKLENEADLSTRIGLLDLLSTTADKKALDLFNRLSVSAPQELSTALVRTAGRLSRNDFLDFIQHQFETSPHPETKAYAVAELFDLHPEKYQETIHKWLESKDPTERKAGVVAAGRTRQDAYIAWLKEILSVEKDAAIIAELLIGLRRLKAPDLNRLVRPFLTHPDESVRLNAMDAFDINDDASLRRFVILLGDHSDLVVKKAKEKIINADYQNSQLLVKLLSTPKRRIREGLFSLIEKMEIKDIDTVQYANRQIEKCYTHLAESVAVSRFPASPSRDLLVQHLNEKKDLRINNILRILSIMDTSGRMKLIYRGIYSFDAHQKGNSVEALDNLLEKSLTRVFIPLLEDMSPGQQMSVGRKYFDLPVFPDQPEALAAHFSEKRDWLSLALIYYISNKLSSGNINRETRVSMIQPGEDSVSEKNAALNIIDSTIGEMKMNDMLTLPDKIFQLRKVEILKDLSVSELAAVAAIAEEQDFSKGDIVIREGEMSQVLYLVIEGETSVIKNLGTDQEIELARIHSNDYFGEMALLEDGRSRSASIRAEKDSRFLTLHKQELLDIIDEYPKIALNFCRVLARRLRILDEKTSKLEYGPITEKK